MRLSCASDAHGDRTPSLPCVAADCGAASCPCCSHAMPCLPCLLSLNGRLLPASATFPTACLPLLPFPFAYCSIGPELVSAAMKVITATKAPIAFEIVDNIVDKVSPSPSARPKCSTDRASLAMAAHLPSLPPCPCPESQRHQPRRSAISSLAASRHGAPFASTALPRWPAAAYHTYALLFPLK